MKKKILILLLSSLFFASACDDSGNKSLSPGKDNQNPGGKDNQNPGDGDNQNPGGGDNQNPGGGDNQNPGDGDNQNPGGDNNQNPKEKCKLVPGAIVRPQFVVDGDTIWVISEGKVPGDCLEQAYNIRLHGISAPECYKEKESETRLYHCVKNETYGPYGKDGKYQNDEFGFESYVALRERLSTIERMVTECDTEDGKADSECKKTGSRSLAYFVYEKDGKKFDLSAEQIGAGYGLAYTVFSTHKMKEYCEKEYDAIQKNLGFWKGIDVERMLKFQNADTRAWYKQGVDYGDNIGKSHDKVCGEAGAVPPSRDRIAV